MCLILSILFFFTNTFFVLQDIFGFQTGEDPNGGGQNRACVPIGEA